MNRNSSRCPLCDAAVRYETVLSGDRLNERYTCHDGCNFILDEVTQIELKRHCEIGADA